MEIQEITPSDFERAFRSLQFGGDSPTENIVRFTVSDGAVITGIVCDIARLSDGRFKIILEVIESPDRWRIATVYCSRLMRSGEIIEGAR